MYIIYSIYMYMYSFFFLFNNISCEHKGIIRALTVSLLAKYLRRGGSLTQPQTDTDKCMHSYVYIY